MDSDRQPVIFRLMLDSLWHDRTTESLWSHDLDQQIVAAGLDISRHELHNELKSLEGLCLIKLIKTGPGIDSESLAPVRLTLMNPTSLTYVVFD